MVVVLPMAMSSLDLEAWRPQPGDVAPEFSSAHWMCAHRQAGPFSSCPLRWPPARDSLQRPLDVRPEEVLRQKRVIVVPVTSFGQIPWVRVGTLVRHNHCLCVLPPHSRMWLMMARVSCQTEIVSTLLWTTKNFLTRAMCAAKSRM